MASQIGPALLKNSIFDPETRKAAQANPWADMPWMKQLTTRQGPGMTGFDLDPEKVGAEIAAALNRAMAGGFKWPEFTWPDYTKWTWPDYRHGHGGLSDLYLACLSQLYSNYDRWVWRNCGMEVA
jgi:hypothetical protein